MSKIIVTGGAGFIGSNLVDKLIDANHEVTILDNLSTGSRENINPKAKFIFKDLKFALQAELDYITKNTEYMFLCAALPNVQFSVEEPYESNKSNVDTILKTLIAAKNNSIKKVIYSGSCSCYGNATNFPTNEQDNINPLSPYALQKYIGEEYCRLYSKIYDVDTVVLRYFNVYGPRMTNKGAYRSVLSVFLEAYKNKEQFNIVNDGTQKRDFVHVDDVVNANILSMQKNTKIESSINIGYGENYSVNEIADIFKAKKQYTEKRIEPQLTLADISKAKDVLGWKPKVQLTQWLKEQL